ncbi:protein mono-ADP-ribosyltransferase PARP9 isoform X2 [Anarrhichthys ocellatus]|uniref:protein mono-ADP-ribosyltransferase PARP9 isoform X2 n=1 Tax=Anarrhichthys ocellatus TaxID=433405 RepID=UPI0012ED597D|nr:protein mono-ADP-ribosyltransferase PARP9 isoform X2 [Anarrhichthys ocellatus]
MASKLDITLRGTSLNIVRQCGPALSGVVKSKFGCEATIDGVDFERDPRAAQQRRPTVKPEKRFATTLHGGVQLSVWRDDLTNVQADAVVNAANEGLQHCGGLAQALSDAGGSQIQRESDNYVANYGPLKTGDAVVLGAGSLPCKKIIHAVGPCLPSYPFMSDVSRSQWLLEKVICSILDKVKENQLQSVAIPAISSGLFNYPLPECATTIVITVKRYYENAIFSAHLPKEILLVNNDEPTVAEMVRACRQILPDGNSSGAAKTSAGPVQLGNVLLTLKTGKIEEQQTDVIVNTTSPGRDLSSGVVSKALLKKAGRKMQEEIIEAPLKECLITTKPYMLHCKEVFHTLCPDRGIGAAEKRNSSDILYKSVLECLWQAAAHKHKSIAFPAIGTGGLGFSKKESAHIMTQAVADFDQKSKTKMDVHFVIFPSDNDTFKAFEEQMGSLKHKASHPGSAQANWSSPAVEHREGFLGGSAPTPQIRLNGPSNEAKREAKRWLTGLLFKSSGPVIIYNNFIQHFGEQEHLQLSRLVKGDLSIEEFFENGRASLTVSGEPVEDVVVAGLQVEAMLCNIQKNFATEEEDFMQAVLTKSLSFGRKMVDNTSPEFLDRLSIFKEDGLWLLQMEKVENIALETLFGLKKKQLSCTTPPQQMLQHIPAHFCEMVSHIGFHAEYAPPDEPLYGEGIYFAGDVKAAMKVWKGLKEKKEEYLYFVEAEVLTGRSAPGKKGLILPPAVETDPLTMYDSVNGGPDVSVVFSSYQALPTYIMTCKMG